MNHKLHLLRTSFGETHQIAKLARKATFKVGNHRFGVAFELRTEELSYLLTPRLTQLPTSNIPHLPAAQVRCHFGSQAIYNVHT